MLDSLPTVKGQLLTPQIAQSAAFEALPESNRTERVAYLKRHGVAKLRSEAGL